MKKLTSLFEPIKVGPMELKNRIVMTGIAITSTEDTSKLGVIHDKYVDYFEERARGGVGLIIFPDTCVDRNLRFQSHPCIGGDEFNPGLSSVTEAVHMWGAKIAPDLWYSDAMYRQDIYWHPPFPYGSDWRPLSTSPLSFEPQMTTDFSIDEIQEVEELFADAALRARLTGFDAIHLAGHFGFFINQFMSPFFNKRTDMYGGSLENRMRLPVEIIDRIKAKVGNALPIIFRLSADEFTDGGLTIEETKVIVKKLQDAGVDMLNIIAGLGFHPDQFYQNIPVMGSPQGPFVDLAAQIKRVVDIPVIVAGRITDPLFAEKILEDEKADMVGMARQLLADPEWPVKAAEGRLSDIIPCIGCNVCLERLIDRTISRCSVNAALGREKEFRIVPAVKQLKVLVVGGGPAGMEAARVAALRGHMVSLYEKESMLGGQLVLSSKPPYKDEIRQFMEYLIRQVKQGGIEITLGVAVTPETIKDAAPDVVILATGALPLVPEIPGIDGRNVVTAWDVLSGKEVGERVVIVGGGMVGCETAEYLIHKEKKVSIVEMLPEIASDVERFTVRTALLKRLAGYNLNIFVNSTAEAVNEKGLVTTQLGEKKVVEAHNVILAMGAVPNDMLIKKLRNSIRNFYVIGDCSRPNRILHAINQASYVARQI